MKTTIIAVSGVVAIGIGLLLYYGLSGNPLDTEIIKQIAAGLIGFAGGAGAVSTTNNIKPE
jgi:hypothetical protein